MRNILKVAVVVIVAILLSASTYVLFFTDVIDNGEADDEDPTIDTITGNTTGTTGKITIVSVTFSDNVEVTGAILYYKTVSASDWSSTSILNRSVDLSIPLDSNEDWYYYVTIDDAAGNGPVGDPSTDGSVYYTITVSEENEEFVHTVFIEEGTATDCRYCPNVGKILDALYESNDYNFYYVSLIEDASEEASNRLKNEFNTYGNPTVYIDGGFKVIRGGLNEEDMYAEAISVAESRNVPKIRVTVNAEYDNNTNEILCVAEIENKEAETYSGNLRLYLTEKISSSWNDYDGKKYHFAFIDYIINKDISIDSDGKKSYQETWDASDLIPENLMIIAVVFNSESVGQFANPPDGNPFDAYYADAADAAEVVEGGDLPPEVGIILPQQGKMYFRGKPILEFLYKNRLLNKTRLLGKITITAYATDDSSVDKVELYIDDELISTLEEEPYEWSFRSLSTFKKILPPYIHTVMVKAYDDSGKISTDSIEIWARL